MGIQSRNFTLIPEKVASGIMGMLWDGWGLHFNELDIPFVCLDSLLHRSAGFTNVNLIPHSQGILWILHYKSTGFPVSAIRLTSVKLVDQCRRESRSLTGISHLQRHRPLSPRSMPTTPETACSGMKIKFIDCDPHFYTCRVKEAIHITPHSKNIKKDNGIEIPEA